MASVSPLTIIESFRRQTRPIEMSVQKIDTYVTREALRLSLQLTQIQNDEERLPTQPRRAFTMKDSARWIFVK